LVKTATANNATLGEGDVSLDPNIGSTCAINVVKRDHDYCPTYGTDLHD